MKRPASLQSGSTLMLALWALFLLSAVVFAWVQWVDRGIDGLSEANRGMEARAMAHSGLAVALHPDIAPNSPHLEARFEGGRAYRVQIKSEGGRVNLNYLLSGSDPARLAYLKQFLTSRGLTFQEREVLVDCLLDWVSPRGGARRLHGMPESPGYRPPHRPLQSLDELPLVAGSAPLVSRPDWKQDFTLFSSGPFDLECVPAGLLALVPGIGEQRAAQFVKTREARERKGVTPDGRAFKNRAEALSFLGLSPQQASELAPFLGFRDPVLCIQSNGDSGRVNRRVEVIARKVPGANAQILMRMEN